MRKLRESAGERALQLLESLADLPFLIVEGKKLPLDSIVQLAQVSTSHSSSDRNQYLYPNFCEYAFING
jgi:hypothetical protein